MATPSFAALRRAFPRARIAILLRPGRDGVVEGLPDFDEVLLDRTKGSFGSWLRLVRELRRERFELGILFTNSLRSALAVFLAGVRVRVGYRHGGQRPFLTRAVEPEREGRGWKPAPMPDLYARLLSAAGVEPGGAQPRLAVTPRCEEEAGRCREALGIAPGEELIGLAPGASFGASKLWPADRFAALADSLTARYGRRTIIFCGPGEESIASEIARAMKTAPINTAERPLGLDLLKPFVRDVKLLVTTDSGPRHYANAFGVAAVVVMGPTDPRWSAYALERSEVVRHDVECGPCHLAVCPIDHHCMTGITPAEVLERIEQLDRRLGIF
jgi:heptosyltransferase-2